MCVCEREIVCVSEREERNVTCMRGINCMCEREREDMSNVV